MEHTTLQYFGTSLTSHGHYFWILADDRLNKSPIHFQDIPFNPENLLQGERIGTAKFFRFGEYTVCAIVGSCYDTRGGSWSVFFIEKKIHWTALKDIILGMPIANRMIRKMEERFPIIWPVPQPVKKSAYIVLDFDGTCVAHEFPNVGHEIGAVPVLKELLANGHKLILFTMRGDKETDGQNHLANAIDWFAQNDIPLTGVQTNPSQHIWTNSPKAYGEVIIDDAALGCPLVHQDHPLRPYVDWPEVRKRLVNMGYIKDGQ